MLEKNRITDLEDKIEKAKEIFDEAFKRFSSDDMRIIWSGGKDSTLTLWICCEYCKEKSLQLPKVFTIDEGDSFDEIENFLKKYENEWKLNLDWGINRDVLEACGYRLNGDVKVNELNERNRAEIKRIGFDLESFPFEAESYVGNHLMKTVVFNTYLESNGIEAVFQGLRWDEQPARKNDPYTEEVAGGEMTPPHVRYRPILHFTERDVWDTTFHFKIPFCKLYEEGYRSLGAKTTSQKSSNNPAWEQDLENTVERAGRRQDKEKTMARLRMLGYM